MRIIAWLRGIRGKIIPYLEDSTTPFIFLILSFLFILTLRCYIETFASQIKISPFFFTHFISYYIAMALVFILILCAATKENITKILLERFWPYLMLLPLFALCTKFRIEVNLFSLFLKIFSISSFRYWEDKYSRIGIFSEQQFCILEHGKPEFSDLQYLKVKWWPNLGQ